jgi:hypothetical protein
MTIDERTINKKFSDPEEAMPKKLTRRDLLKISAGAAAAAGLAPAFRSMVIEPFIDPPEDPS